MLTLVTGVPGAGKTLYALGLAEEYRAQGRTIYHNGINGLSLPWELLPDGKPWTDLPDGSVVVLDEAQQRWRVRAQGSRVPDEVVALETHRHRGFDFILTTQSPGLIDVNVRKLCGRHFHLTRKHGLARVGLYRWEHCEASPESRTAQAQALKEMWTHPKERFGWYTSAVLHTHKSAFPWKLVFMLGGGLAAVGGLAWFAVWNLGSEARKHEAQQDTAGETVSMMPVSTRGRGNPWEGQALAPRLAAFPESAEFFDRLYADARSAPAIAGCMSLVHGDGATQCICTTDQGARLDLSLGVCMSWMRTGRHDWRRAPIDVNAAVIARLDAQGREGPPVVNGQERSSMPRRESASELGNEPL